jgi:hypothetical protein
MGWAMRVFVAAIILPAIVVSGCATKNYGRLQPLTGAERAAYTCREIDLEIAKVQAFQQQVIEGAQFNVASVLGILGDYGIGNNMERSSAEASAARRLGQLNDLKAERGCYGTTLTAADQRAAVASVANAPRATVSADPADAPGTIDLGGGVKLVPAKTLSGYCIKAPSGYVGTGSVNRPAVTNARPICG